MYKYLGHEKASQPAVCKIDHAFVMLQRRLPIGFGRLRDWEACEDLNCVIAANRCVSGREQVFRLFVILGFPSAAYPQQ